MTVTDKVIGATLLAASFIILAYYTTWVFVTPFLTASSPIQAYFPERSLAIAIPTVLFTAAACLGSFLVSLILLKSRMSKKTR